MIEKVRSAIQRYNMLSSGDLVTVALSGGADSTALLLALHELGYKVCCVHVNHNLRGEESLRDELFCKSLCADLNVPLMVESVDVKGHSAANKLSTEEAARDLRYAAIFRHSGDCPVATAHNLNDCFETTLFNLTRGTSLGGILGIPPVRDKIIRPLILCTRQEILEYLKSKNQPWAEDSTNAVADCTRNIIRLEIVPKLLEINPGLYKTYLNFLETVGETKNHLDSEVSDAYNSNLTANSLNITDIPEGALRSNALRLYLKSFGVDTSYDKVSLILNCIPNGSVTLQKGVYAVVRSGILSVVRDEDKPERLSFPVTLNENFAFGDSSVTITKLSQLDISHFNKNELKYALDLDKLHGEIIARSTYGNETIRLLDRDFTSTVKKLFAQISSSGDRPKLLVLSDDEGVFFAQGFGVDKRVCCDESTTNAVKINII